MSLQKLRIPVYSGPMILEFVRDEGSLRRYAHAATEKRNVELITTSRGSVVRINVYAVLVEDEEGHGIGPNSMKPTYDEDVAPRPMKMLKRYDADGTFKRWSDKEGFNPKRFNPEREAARFARQHPIEVGIGRIGR